MYISAIWRNSSFYHIKVIKYNQNVFSAPLSFKNSISAKLQSNNPILHIIIKVECLNLSQTLVKYILSSFI